MQFIKLKIKNIIGVILFFFLSFNLAQAISIAPSVIEFRAKPGETKEFKIKIKNDEKNEVCFKLAVEAISKMNADGSPVFDTVAASDTIAPWFSLKEKNICAKPGEIISPTLVVRIPNNIKPAGYYAAVYFISSPQNSTAIGSTIVNRVGVLVAIRVDGENVLEQARIGQFIFDEDNKKFIVDFVNEGTVHLRPYGEIVIKTDSGRVVDTLLFNQDGVLVLPGSSRRFLMLWDKSLNENSLATLNIFYGTGPKQATAVVSLKKETAKNEMKTRLMIIGLLVLGAVAFGYVIKKIRRNNY